MAGYDGRSGVYHADFDGNNKSRSVVALTDHACSDFFFFKQKTAYEFSECTGVQTCALPISLRSSDLKQKNTRFLNVTGVQTCALPIDRKSTRLNSSHIQKSRMPSSA